MSLQLREQHLRRYLRERSAGGGALAYSGGVDSSLLLHLLREIQAEAAQPFPLLALYIHSPLHPARDLDYVRQQAGEVELHIETVDPLLIPELRGNTRLRCYHCKRGIFTKLLELAAAAGCQQLIEGTNADDLLVYRPGKQAIRELGVLSPLAELGISKAEVRAMAASLGLSTATRPSTPCLATRFDYDTELREEDLQRVERGEQVLRDLFGAKANLRLRVHLPQQLARIEVDPDHFPQLLRHREAIAQQLRQLGYKQITLDIQGFRSGSMDE